MQKLLNFRIIRTIQELIRNSLTEDKAWRSGRLLERKPFKSDVPHLTILGLLRFLLYVSELPRTLKSSTVLFEDYVKIQRTINSDDGHPHLQADINELFRRRESYGLELNYKKMMPIHTRHICSC